MPNAAAIQAWRSQVPDSFRFAIKVPRRISHIKRLRDCGEELEFLLRALADLAPVPRLAARAASAACALRRGGARGIPPRRSPRGTRVAFEFRNDSWHVPAVFELLEVAQRRARAERKRRRHSSRCHGPPIGPICGCAESFTRRTISTGGSIGIDASGVKEAQVFFKHEDGATGPKLAAQLLAHGRAALAQLAPKRGECSADVNCVALAVPSSERERSIGYRATPLFSLTARPSQAAVRRSVLRGAGNDSLGFARPRVC